MFEYHEKRDFIRMEIECPMTYNNLHEQTRHDGVCINLSGSGLRFTTSVPPREDSEIEIQLLPPKVGGHQLMPPLNASIHVIRVTAHGEEKYTVAAKIVTVYP